MVALPEATPLWCGVLEEPKVDRILFIEVEEIPQMEEGEKRWPNLKVE